MPQPYARTTPIHRHITVPAGRAAHVGHYQQAPCKPTSVLSLAQHNALASLAMPKGITNEERHRIISVIVTTLRYYDIDRFKRITGENKRPCDVECRHVLSFLLARVCKLGPTATGRVLQRDHSTVSNSLRRVTQAQAGGGSTHIDPAALSDSVVHLTALLERTPPISLSAEDVLLLTGDVPPRPLCGLAAQWAKIAEDRPKIVAFVRDYWTNNNTGPLLAEIAAELGRGIASTRILVSALRREGILCSQQIGNQTKARALRLVGQELPPPAPARSCRGCGGDLVRKDKEGPQHFAKRQYCHIRCYFGHQEGSTSRRARLLLSIRNQAPTRFCRRCGTPLYLAQSDPDEVMGQFVKRSYCSRACYCLTTDHQKGTRQ